MTRKRFVKLVMSCGYDRNMAESIAKKARAVGESYEIAFTKSFRLKWQFLCKARCFEETLIKAVKPVIKWAKDVIQQFSMIILVESKRAGLDWGESDDRSYVGGSPEVVAADLSGDEERGATAEQTKHSGTVSG